MIKALQIARAYSLIEQLDGIRSKVWTMNSRLPCKEFQNILMDLESAQLQVAKFVEDGPSTAYVDIPLEQSEIKEEEIEEKDVWDRYPYGEDGPSEGDIMMSSEWSKE